MPIHFTRTFRSRRHSTGFTSTDCRVGSPDGKEYFGKIIRYDTGRPWMACPYLASYMGHDRDIPLGRSLAHAKNKVSRALDPR